MTFDWTLCALMKQRHVQGVRDLHQRLQSHGLSISRTTVFRLMHRPPRRIRLATLLALCDVLKCTPTDLIRVKIDGPEAPAPGFSLGRQP